MKCRLIVLLMVLVLAASAVNALTVTHKGATYVEAGGVAEFSVTVYNDGSNQQVFNIQSDPYASLESSRFEYVIVSPTRLELDGYEKGNIKVVLKLKENVKYGENYATFIKIESLNHPSVKEDHYMVVRVVEPSQILSMSASLPDEVGSGRDFSLDLILKNKLNTQLLDVRAYVSSDMFEEERGMQFFPEQERTETFTFAIPPLTQPGEYNLNIRVYSGEKLVRKSILVMTVAENVDVKERTEYSSGFLYSKLTMIKANHGNSPVQESFSVKMSAMQRLFAKYNIAPTLKDGNQISWVAAINPERQYTVEVTIDYRPLFFAVLLAVIFAVIIVHFLTRKVSIRKEILTVERTPDGMSKLKVLLHVKNRTRKNIRHITLVEFLPSIIHPAAKFATLKPSKMQKGEKGVKLIWEIKELVKGEERIISYEVKSKLGIIGRFMLPYAVLKYRSGRGKQIAARSNNVSFHSFAKEIEENQ